MGFGYLFVGTVLTVNVVVHGFTDLLAYILILMGMSTLKDYGPRLRTAYMAAWPLLPIGLLELIVSACDLLEFPLSTLLPIGITTKTAIRYASLLGHAAYLVFTFLLLRGIRTLAHETEAPTIEVRAFRNQLLAFLYHVPMIFIEIPFAASAIKKAQSYMLMPFLLYGLIYLILQAKLVFSCYMWICPEEDVDMERRPSRFSIVNRMNRLSDRIDDRTLERKREEREAKAAREQARKERKKKRSKK